MHVTDDIVRQKDALWSSAVGVQLDLLKGVEAEKPVSWRPNPSLITRSGTDDMFGASCSGEFASGFLKGLQDTEQTKQRANYVPKYVVANDNVSVDSDIIRPVLAQPRMPSGGTRAADPDMSHLGGSNLLPNPLNINPRQSFEPVLQLDTPENSMPARKLPTLKPPVNPVKAKKEAAPQWTSHTSTKVSLNILT